MMTKKEMQELATIVSQAVVEAMKATSAKPVSAHEGRKSATPMKAKKSDPKYSTNLADYEPKKKDNNYIWGKPSDTTKSGHYMAMQKAYCYAVATNGKAITSDECYKMGIEVDFTEGGAYAKAKEQFKKQYIYIKKADR